MDIKSAAKAHTAEHKLEERTLTTEYYEPAAIPSAAAPQTPERPAAAAAGPYTTATANARFPNSHGSSEEHTGFSERFYERGSGRVADPEYLRRPGYHDTSRGRARDRLYRNGPTYPTTIIDSRHRSTLGSAWPYEGTSARYSAGQAPDAAYVSTTPVAEPAERRSSADVQVVKKKTKSRSGSRTPSPSGSTSSRSPSRSRSRSSSSSSSSSTSRGSSSPTSSPRTRGSRVQSAVSAAPPVHSEDRRPLAIIVRNLPARSSDTSLKDGLFHEYKKHGKVTWVKVVGQSSDRYALVCFKKPDDVDKALEVSYDKSFFGCKIEVGPYQGYDVEDNEFRPYEAELDEYHPKATRTLFIGNLEKDVTASDLRKHFDTFGEIIEIDIKKQGAVSSYAFCQYSDIVSVVKAIRKMDGEHLGNNRIKLGFGKSMPTPCVWVDGVSERVDEKYLTLQFERYGQVTQVSIDRDRGHALIFFEQLSCAQTAVKEMRGVTLRGKKLQVDFASRECQDTFFDHLEKQGAGSERPAFDTARDPVQRERSFETSTLAPATRYTSTRYDTPSRPRTSSYSSRSGTGSQCTGSSAVPSPGTPGSVTPRGSGSRSRLTRFNEYYEAGVEYPERRFRSYDEFSQGSGASHEDVYEHEYIYNRESPGHVEPVESRTMQSVVVTTEIPPTVTTFVPPDIRHLQKERVHLLEQLDECPSSGDELMSPKKRMKLDICDGGTVVTDVVVDVSHGDHRKVIEVRRLSDTTIKHHSRRPSIDGKHCIREVPVERTYMPHAVCKRRKTSGSESDRPRIHHHHDMSGSESLAGSRPGTPLCDERPENLPPSEPRRLPRERNANEGPLSLPLPRFAAQVLNSPRLNISVAGFKGSKENIVSSPPAAVTSPKVANPIPPSPVHVPPPASPPPRPPSSSNSSDSDAAPPSPSLEERLRSLDEKYEKWSGSRALSAAGGDALAKLDASASERFRFRHKLLDLDLKELQPSEIVKSVLAKRSVFDEDSKRLENVGEKYEPRDFTALPRTFVSPLQTNVVGVATPPAVPASPLLSPATSSAAKSLPGTALSPRSLASSIPAAKGLQYPFPSHPPVVSPVAGGTASAPSPARVTGNVHSDNTRLKLCPSLPSDRTNSKVNLNRSGCAAAPPSSVVSGAAVASTVSKHKSLDKNGDSDKINSNIPINSCENASVNVSSSATTVTCSAVNSSSDAVTNHVGKTPPRDKSTSRKEDRSSDKVSKGDKVVGRRDSVSSSPSSANSSKCDRKDRREKKSEKDNDTNGDYRTGKAKDNDSECDRKREKESEYCDRKLEEEKQRTERERAEKERQETERKEKEERERLEKERQEHERQEKERLEIEKLEKERQEKERQEREKQERLEKERLERERKKEKEERERQERERREREERDKREREERERREREERERREKEEREKREKEEREKREKEEQIERERIEKEKQRERERREKEEKERREREELEKERQEKELHERQMKEKQEHRKREKEIEKHERRHKEDNHESKEKKKDKEDYDKDKQKQRENHSDNSIDIKNRHRENHIDAVKVNDRHRDNHDSRKENNKDHDFRIKDTHENMRNNHEMQRKDSHDKSKDHHDSSRSNSDRRDEKHSHCNDVRKDESSKNRHHIEREDSKEKRKDSIKEIRDINNHEKNRHFSTDSRDNNKDRHSSTDSRHTSTDSEKNRQYNDHALNSTPNRIDVSKRKDKVNSAPASVGCKRRISSQDSSESPDDSKRLKVNAEHRKISDRRDSKDSRDSNASRSSDKIKQNKHNKSNFTRMLEDKIREEKRNKELSDEKRREKEREREREDRHKLKQQKIEKQKIKSKNRESRDSKDSPGTPKSTTKELLLDKDFLARLDLRANDDEEKQKLQRKDSKEKRKLENHEIDERRSSDDTKRPDERRKDKIVSGEKKRDENMIKNSEDKNKNPQQRKEPQRIRKQTNSSDTSDSDEPKKHSIFDIVDDEPAYISMYDKVKARSCKNMQKQEEEKRQEKLKAKFTQLKQSRAKREEKKRSTSWDEDSDSDHMDSGNQDHQDQEHITNKQNRRGNKMLITSSSEDELHSMNKSRKKPDMYTDSDSDRVRLEKLERINDSSDEEAARNKSVSRKGSKSRITSDTSEDEQPRKRVEKIKKERYSDSEVDQGFADSDERTDMKHYKKPKEEKLNHYDEDKYIKKEKKPNTKITSLSDDETTRKMLTDAVKAEIYAEKEEIKIENRLAMLCDISSEGENVHNMEIKKDLFGEEKSENRKKHKKQKKRQKNSLLSEDTIKLERMLDEVENDSGNRGDESLSLEKKMSEKKKHGSKKDKKRDKVKDEDRIKEKSKKLKKLNKELCSKGDLQHVIKRDGKLEDIFGSFSDDSETGNKDSLMNNIGNKENSFFVHLSDKLQSSHMYASDSDSIIQQIDPEKEKLKEESRKRKEKKRKEKERRMREENENSVDFADLGKVLEDNLKDEPMSDEVEKSVKPIKTEPEEEQKAEENHNSSDIFRFSDDDDSPEIEKKEFVEKKEMKEKKKKRKKSKEEKQNRHHHHHEKNQDKVEKIKSPDLIKKELPALIIENIKEESDVKPSQQSPSLPNLLDIPSPPQAKSISNIDFQISPLPREPLISPIPKTPTSSKVEKKREKFIPGFGSEIDEKIHENAVKSISDFGSPTLNERIEQEEIIKAEDEPKVEKTEVIEDKPRVIISQEETEDAVAALLGESFGGGDFNCYNESQPSPTTAETTVETTNDEVTLAEDDEEMRQAVQSLNAADMEAKPDTPQSEHDLQIDTDTDDGEEVVVPYEQSPRTPDMVDLSRPPKTPDFPTGYYRPPQEDKIQTPVLIKTSTNNTISQIKSPAPKEEKSISDPINEVKRNIEVQIDKPVIQAPVPRKIEQSSPEASRTVISQSWTLPNVQLKPPEKIVVSEPVKVEQVVEKRKPEQQQNVTQHKEEPKPAPHKPVVAQKSLPSLPTSLSLPPLQSSTQSIVTTPTSTVLTSQSKYLAPPIIKISDHTSHSNIISPKLEQSLSPVKNYNNINIISTISTTIPPALTTVMSKQRTMPQIPATKPVRIHPPVISHLTVASSKAQNPPLITQSGGLLTTVVTSTNAQQNRLPIQSIMASKPIQPTTMILPQSKIAVSTIQKIVSSPEVSKPQEPTRMIYHSSGNMTVPSYSYPHTLCHPQPMPTSIPVPLRTAIPQVGLLAPARHILPPTSYSLPSTTRSLSPLVKEQAKSVIEKTMPVISELQKPAPISMPAHIYSQPSFSQSQTSLHMVNTNLKATPVIKEAQTPKLIPLTTPEVRISQPSIIQQAPPQKPTAQEIIRHSPVSQSVVSQAPHSQPPMIVVSKPVTTVSNSTVSHPVISHVVMSQPVILQPTASQPVTSHTVIPQSVVSQQSLPVTSHKVMSQSTVSQQSQPITSHKVMPQSIVSQHSQPVTAHKVMPQSIVSQSQSVSSHKMMPQSIVSQQSQSVTSHKVMPQSVVSQQSQPVTSPKVMPQQSIGSQQSQPVTSHKVMPQSIVSQQSQPVTSHKVMPQSIISQQSQPITAHKVMPQSIVSQQSQSVTSHKVMPQIIVSQQSQPHILVSQHSQAMIPKSIISQPIISQSISTTAIVSHTSTPKPVISHSAAPTLSVTTDITTVKSQLENRTPTTAPQDIINEIPKVIKETISRSTPSPVIVSTPKEHLSPVPPPVQETQIKKEESVEKDNPSPNINKHIPEDNLHVQKEIKSEDNKLAIIEDAKVEIKPKVEVTEADEKKLEIKQHPEPIEGISVIKEVDHYEKEKQEDTESVISEPKESLTSELCLKDDPLDSKEDSDYWSAKEVNIESVIKKVDALCSADELSEGSEAGKDEWYENETKVAEPETKQHESIGKEPEKSEDCDNSDVTKTDAESENLDESVDNNSEEKEQAVRNRGRGGRLRGRKNNKSDKSGVTTRRGKSATTTTSRRGGRGGRTRNDKKTKQSESDVYEFHDDSDESKDRPRLILTIKSPAGAGNTPSTPSAVIKETVQKPPEPPLEFVSPAANTRKSRRIQERDGSRNTVDDIIEDVVRNAAVVTRSAAAAAQGLPSPRRSTRQNVLKQPPVIEPRKSPRATRRKDRRVSENTDDSSEEKSVKKEELKSEPEPVKEEVAVKEVIKVPPKQQEKEKIKIENTPPLGLKANLIRRLKSEEPMTLIDPVTGLLTQMRECEEGKYIPVSNSASSVITGTVTTRPSVESKSAVPDTCRLSTSTVTSVHHPVEQAPTTVIAKSQPANPVLQKPQSLKAHVLSSQAAKVVVNQAAKVVVNQAAKVVVNQPAPIPKTATVQTVPQPQQQQQQPNLIAKPNVPVSQHLNVNVSLASTMDPTNLSPRQTPPKPIHVLPQTMKNVTPSPMSPNQIGTISNPKQHFLQAAKQQIPPKPSTPINPKTHLLNAVQNQNIVSGSPSVVNATLTHIKSTHMPQSSSLPSPVKQQVVVANVAPIVKPHNLHVPQQILTGAVASPPLKHHIAQQPIVTGASSGRMGIPSSSPMPGISAKGAMDPQKVEVSMAGCVMISHPTVSPQAQARGQVLQAGMPVPAYEASLHGVGDHPLFSRQSPPPAHQQTSPAPQGEPLSHFPPGAMPLRTPHDLPPHHFMHSHPVYQQYLRAQQEARIPYHLPRSPMVGGLEKTKDGQEGEEAPVTSPPLELRRPGSVGLTPRPTAVPHSLQSPHDRATDSPQVAQVYVHQPRIPHYHTPGRYYEPTEPPPAHRPVTSHTALTGPGSSLGAAGNLTGAMARHTGAEAPATQRGLQVATPPHASQVPPQADSLLMLLKQYRIMWQGLLALKNDQAAVQMHFVFGNPHVARNSLPCNSDGSTPPLRIAQRMRLEKTQVEGVARKMQMENEHCVLLALPCGRDHMDVLQQSTNLSHGFITYLQQKEAAGIVNIAAPGSQHAAYVVHIFPSCDFVKENLARIAPNLLHRVADIAHLLIVIATV